MAEDFGFVPDPPKKKEKEDFGFIPDDPASQTKLEYVEQGGKPEDVYSPERAKILVEQGPEALIAEPPLKRGDGSIAGPTLPTEEALAKGLIEKRAEPAVKKALEEGVDTVSSGYDQEKGVGFAVGRGKDGKVVRVEKEPDNFGFVPDEPKKKAEDFGFVPDQPKRDGLQPMSEYQRPDPANDDPTFVGALGRGAIRSALPTAAGIATGAATGAAIGAVATGPFAPAGAAIGGLAFGMAAAFGAEKLQDYGLEKIVSPETKKAIDEQFAKDAEKQPVASFAGQVAPSFALFRPSPSNLAKAGSFAKQIMSGQVTKEALETPAVREQASNLLNVAFGAGTQTGLEAYGQLERGEFDPLRLGASVVIGALQTEPTRLGKATITEPMARMEEAIRARKTTPQDAQSADMAEPKAQQEVATTEPQAQEQTQPEDPFGLTDDRTEILTQKGFSNPEQKDNPSNFIVKDEGMDRPDVLGGPDVIDYIKDLGGILPKGRAESEKNLRLYGKKGGSSINRLQEAGAIAEYDGATGINVGYRKEISGTIAPDEMAQMLLDNYAIGDGSVDGLWSSVSKAIETRNKNKRSMQDFRKAGRQEKAFVGNILKPKNQNKESVTAGQFYKGDKFVAGGEDFRVSDISPDTGAVTLSDGDKYGTQTVRPDTSLFTDTKPVPPNAKQSTPPSEPPPPSKPPAKAQPAPQPAPEPRQTIRQRLKTGLDNFRRTFQDKFVDIENLQKRIEKGKFSLPDAVNIKQSEELFHGRVGERLTSFEEGQVGPIIEDLRNTGIDPATFEKYATAKHARERNAVIAGRNPEMPDGGSGMANAEADRLLAGGIPLEVQAKLEPVRQKLLDINRSTINNLLEGGLISAETHDLLTKRYKDYVPLRGTKNRGVEGGTEFEAARITGTGSGLDVRGSDIIKAGGRKSMANDLLAYAVSQNMDSIVRSEKNRVLLTAARFAKSFKDNGVIVEVKPSEVMKTARYEEDGQTRFAKTIDPYLADAPDIIAYKENGETKYLRINDPRLADVMKNRASPVLGSVIEKLGSLNRYFAFINTQASPEFVISNFARDLQTALVNINSDQAQGLARGLVKNIAPALKATYRAELGKADLGGRMDVFYRQFKAAGGRMTFFGMKDFQTLQKQIQSKLAGGGSNAGARVFRLVLDRVGQLNSAVENATRLATFATLKERGYTDQQAAYAARNITVNFTRKGTAGPLMNAFYLFFNANIQGSARIIQALATSKKAQKIVLGAMAFGFFRDMVNRIVGGEDETGMPIYDKIPEYQRRQNMIIMNPFAEEMGVQYFKFPMPYGYSVFDYAGQLVADTMPSEIYGGGKKPMDSAVNLTLAAIDNFNPIGGSYSLLQAISPTITTPLVDLALNQDFSGRPIMPTPNPFDPVPPPDSQRYWNNVNPASKWVTEKLNEVTGGSKARSGSIDVSPETLDYGYDFLTGAVGKFGERVMMAPIRAAKVAAGQEDVVDLIGDIPMVRKVTGSVPSFVDVKRYQDMRTQILTVERELKLARQAGETERAREIIQDAKPELRLVNMIKATEQDLKELRSQKRKLQEMDKNRTNPAIQKRLDINRERQKALMMKALERYNSSIDDKM
ncbi:MAG: hypothetical protein EBR82_24855 [Caulobacteraceae bacterium]|nr:hypothetical protein [Caulobacteraceae bacterium]